MHLSYHAISCKKKKMVGMTKKIYTYIYIYKMDPRSSCHLYKERLNRQVIK